MNWMLLGFVWLLNFGISAWNAYAVGRSWAEAQAAGGWPRLLAWSGAVMSATGFSWCYLFAAALTASQFGYLDPEQVNAAFALGYVLLVPGLLLSGLVIMLDSWGRAFRQGGFLNYGVAVYNTYAQIHNTYSVLATFPAAFRSVSDYFAGGRRSRDDRDGKLGPVVVVILVAVVFVAGILTTALIIRLTAGSLPMPARPTREQFADSARNVRRAHPV